MWHSLRILVSCKVYNYTVVKLTQFSVDKTLHLPNPPLHAGLGDTGFVLSSHWVGVLAYKKNALLKSVGHESREGLNIANRSMCGRRQKDVCGFDTGWPVLIDTWMIFLMATFQCWVPVVMWQRYLYSCLDISCWKIWSCSRYRVQF
jgi:hypothetical protein